jgi:hypothetical protein
MISQLPFTLTPLDGEPFDVWLDAYAARLAMTPGHLAEALGMPGRWDHGKGAAVTAGPSPAQLAGICAATGLAPSAVVRVRPDVSVRVRPDVSVVTGGFPLVS